MSKRYATLLFSTVLCVGLIGCVYRPTIQQGNVLTRQEIAQVSVGMSEGQVKSILGEPVLVDAFTDQHLVYVYTFKPDNDKQFERRFIIDFVGGRVTHYSLEQFPPNGHFPGETVTH